MRNEYLRAADLLEELATPLFKFAIGRAPSRTEPDPGELHFDCWYTLRRSAGLLRIRCGIEMLAAERESLVGSMRVAHHAAHEAAQDFERMGSPDVCECKTSEIIREIAEIFAAAQEEVTPHAA